ncbi:uncharacterized protein BDW47DRAFT_97726 [Aspergillus candidus]|uniref:EKC/KEOPS complex subunit GON7 n=1 Tax=Aspergillus candidus TaxID=41067 RepID=A0A2I2FQ00_ASPCN|nr:Gon7 family-domain-containing protein [Aspergillus candidus]PLB42712.1 Gon7 family-domain-containing protein [Aspergillus candidus]
MAPPIFSSIPAISFFHNILFTTQTARKRNIKYNNEHCYNTPVYHAKSINTETMSTPLRAVYTSPQSTHSFQHTITAPLPLSDTPSPENVKTKVAYLSELRKLVPALQDDMNVFLTAQMEEEKKAAEAEGRKVSDKEAKEEETYGEEVVEDEE